MYEIIILKSRLIPDLSKIECEDVVIEPTNNFSQCNVNAKFLDSESEKRLSQTSEEFVATKVEQLSQTHIQEDIKIKIGLIKEEIIDDNRKKLDSEIIARAEREQDAMMNSNYSVVKSGELQISKPKHLSYKNFIVEKAIIDDAQRYCKKGAVSVTKFLGSDYDNH